jgi:MoxR-like ATPase
MASIQDLSVKTLSKVLAELNGGSIGFDPFRDPRTNTKAKLLAYILSKHENAAIIAAISKVSGEGDNAPEAPQQTPEIVMHALTPQPLAKQAAKVVMDEGMIQVALADNKDAKVDAKLEALKKLLNPEVDESKVREICDARATEYIDNILNAVNKRLDGYDGKITALTNRKPIVEKIVIESPDKPAVELQEKVNPAFHEILAVASHYPNIMLVGPAGCGKTHLARQVAKALGKSFATISGSAGISESHFTGRLLPTGLNGRFEYTESPFISEYSKDDGCFLIDEFDALDPNCIMVCQGATANGGFTVEARKAASLDPFVPRGKRSLLLASANTYGTGADSLYVGRFQQDAAANDRWYFIPVEYDQDLESTLAPAEICEWVWSLRTKVQEHKIRRVVSTRMIQKAAAAKAAKRPIKEIRERMLAGWTREERQKCGV